MKNITLDDIKAIELDILLVIDKICKENNIDYFLDSGTLLGSIRHKGFIPWDDDIDIGMIREDYDNFISIIESKLPEGYYAQTPLNGKNKYFGFTKIRKSGTHMVEHGFDYSDDENGIWVDVFPYDLVDNDDRLQRQLKKYKVISKLSVLRSFPEAQSGSSVFKRGLRSLLRFFTLVHDEQYYYDSLENLATKTTNNHNCLYICFYYMTDVVLLDKDDIYPLKESEFEQNMFPIINNHEKYLEQIYGDWWVIPDEKDRVVHDCMNVYVD